MEQLLGTILDFATKAHGEQKRKYTPDLYIVHPIRVMETCKRFTNDICILSAALLHDVLEDTSVQKTELEDFLKDHMDNANANRTLRLVTELTDVYVKKDFPNLNRRMRKSRELARLKKTSAESQTIKYADIMDNCSEITDHDPDFAGVFLNECKAVLQNLDKGNKDLHKEAMDTVNKAIERLSL